MVGYNSGPEKRLSKKDKIVHKVAERQEVEPEVVKAMEKSVFLLAKEKMEQGKLPDPDSFNEIRIPYLGIFGIVPANMKKLIKHYYKKKGNETL